MTAGSPQGDPGEANRGAGQQIIDDAGAPASGLDPAAGGEGAGAGEAQSDLPTENDRSRGGQR